LQKHRFASTSPKIGDKKVLDFLFWFFSERKQLPDERVHLILSLASPSIVENIIERDFVGAGRNHGGIKEKEQSETKRVREGKEEMVGVGRVGVVRA